MQKEAGLADEYHSPAFETEVIRGMEGMTIGVDLEDRTSQDCVIDTNGEMVSEGVATTRIAMREVRRIGPFPDCVRSSYAQSVARPTRARGNRSEDAQMT